MAKIFLVDDDKDIIKLFEQFLKFKGHEIVAKAFNGEEALEIYKRFQDTLDLILMDHRMPSKNGLEATKEILAINPNCKIIFIRADYSVRDEVLEIGAFEFIEKPLDFNTLFKLIYFLL